MVTSVPVDKKKRKGLILVNTGEGKGKTTAAMGMAYRAAGNKMKVFVLQFIKGKWKTGEKKIADQSVPNLEIVPMGDGFTWDTKNPEQDRATAMKTWRTGKEKLLSGDFDMVVFDEINYALSYNFLPEEEVIETFKNKPEMTHVVCTGRNAPQALIDIADLVTEMRCIKHPYKEQGIPAQKGIEF
jgi:cob(I)alamin adenosyltransferase